jgi:hypothetical protein
LNTVQYSTVPAGINTSVSAAVVIVTTSNSVLYIHAPVHTTKYSPAAAGEIIANYKIHFKMRNIFLEQFFTVSL